MGKTLIIVPAYNEQTYIGKLVCKLEQFVIENEEFDYVIIDDCSTDRTASILRAQKANFISHPINLGIGEPFKTGIKYGLNKNYDRFINFDGDGQHKLSSLVKLVEAEADYIVGSRYINKSKPLNIRMIGSRILTLAIKIRTHKKIHDPTSGLVLVNNKQIAIYFVSIPSNNPEPSIYPKLLDKFTVEEIQVEMNERLSDRSYFTPYKSLHFMLEQIFMILLKG